MILNHFKEKARVIILNAIFCLHMQPTENNCVHVCINLTVYYHAVYYKYTYIYVPKLIIILCCDIDYKLIYI